MDWKSKSRIQKYENYSSNFYRFHRIEKGGSLLKNKNPFFEYCNRIPGTENKSVLVTFDTK
jgi:hypothetical protein